LAHFTELDWAAQFGVEANLVRFSVGLEETEALKKVFQTALDAISQNETNGNGNAA
jgi:cystathionine gamma-synthase